EGPTELERAHRLQALELQPESARLADLDERRSEDVIAEPLTRAADLLERDQLGSLSLASSVSSVRTVQSSGNSLCLMSPARSSTGVPCVPTTSSPITRPT